MGYLIAHIAIWLIFAHLLGLFLGWLFWGYVAQRRSLEIISMRERIAEMHLSQQRLAAPIGPQMALPEHYPAMLVEDGVAAGRDLPRSSLLKPAEETPAPIAAKITNGSPAGSGTITGPPAEPPEPDRSKQLELRVRQLESIRDRLPLLQADLSDAISARRSAEAKLQEARSEFEARSQGLLTQIRDFENAGRGWDRVRAELETSSLEKEKELALVKAHLRDLQNNQRPQTVEPAAAQVSGLMQELAELRDRHQKATRERDALAAQMQSQKLSETARITDTSRLAGRAAELEAALRAKDATIAEQISRIEVLLWRVAELEPFSAVAPRLEEEVKRQELEIATHLAMHTDSADKIHALELHIDELRKEVERGHEIERLLNLRQAEMQRLTQQRAEDLKQFRLSLAQKDELVTEKAADVARHSRTISDLQSKIAGLERTLERIGILEQSLREREAEMQRLTETHDRQRTDLQTQMNDLSRAFSSREQEHRGLLEQHRGEIEQWKGRASDLEPAANRVPGLERMLTERDAEIASLKNLQNERDAQIKALQERLSALSAKLSSYQQTLEELQPAAARAPVLELQLQSLEQRYQSELTRLKVNSAQRIRRLRQSINSIRG